MPKHLPLRHVILGPGEPDKKTQGLIDFSKRLPESFGGAAKQLKLSLPDSAAVTPALCKDFMDKAGCTSADTPASAKEKMQNCRHAEFDSAMKGIYQFHYGDAKNYSDILSLRSGDLGATGVHSSVFAGIFTNLPDSQSLNAIKGASIGVLASSFSDDAKAMAGVFSRLGGNGIGILANKFIGNDVKFGEVEGISHISPSFTLSYLAPLSKFDYELVQIFRGIASSPANASNYAAFKLKSSEDLGERFIYVHHLLASGLHDEGGSLKIVKFKPNAAFLPYDKRVASAGSALAAALKEIRGKSKLHAELVCADASKLFEWAILQISSAGWLNAARPYSRPLDGYHIADAVMGFADAKVSGVHHAGAIPKQEDSSYNKAHKNYLLTVEVKDLVAFNRNWRISDYSNAGAIALIARESGNLVFSHFGGALRMLGMPVFVFDHGTGAARAVLSLDLDAKCNVYADEMAAFKEQRGGIGPIAESTKKQFSFWPFNKL